MEVYLHSLYVFMKWYFVKLRDNIAFLPLPYKKEVRAFRGLFVRSKIVHVYIIDKCNSLSTVAM
jgi:hypothetical protein